MLDSVDNLFARDGFYWWMGVVEDRMDPLKLGRCRVRIMGYHIDNIQQLPTEDLPWAMPMQGITSAAISGKGDAPLGPLEGTWVVGFFADGRECQIPVMMGTIGGSPTQGPGCLNETTATPNVKRDSSGNVITDETGQPIPNTPTATDPTATSSKSIKSDLPPLTQAQIQSIMNALGQRESSSVVGGVQNYSITNDYGYVGKYQFGASALQTLGYLTWPIPARARQNSEMNTATNWSNKNGVRNLADWKANKNNCQEIAMYELLQFNYNSLKDLKVITTDTPAEVVAGYLSVSHLLGTGGARDFKQGIDGRDGRGTSANTYYNLGVRALNGTPTSIAGAEKTSPNTATNYAGALNNPKMGFPLPYGDPNNKYPLCDYVDRQDTNKLATNNDSMEPTYITEKTNGRVQNVLTANGANSNWAEPPSAYNARYPFNKVKESEAGHIIEIDDTPNAERLHIYHKTGTFIEIDKNGTVNYKIVGDNYEIYNRNNKIYIKGNSDITVDGAQTLLVKNTLDVEVLGKTTVNLRNDADVNVAGTLNIKAKNINLEAQQNLNIKSGVDTNITTGADFEVYTGGDEQHRNRGDFDLDANTVNINSGTSTARGNSGTGLPNGAVSQLTSNLGVPELPIDIANPLNSVGKNLNGVLGLTQKTIFSDILSTAGGLTNDVFGGGGLGNILKSYGVPGLNNVLQEAGLGSVNSIIQNAGLNIGDVNTLFNTGGLEAIDAAISGAGLGSLNDVLRNAGFDISAALTSNISEVQGAIMSALKTSGAIPTNLLEQGENIVAKFVKNGVANISSVVPKFIANVAVDASEFTSWITYPEQTKLSRYFELGDLTSRVAEVSMQTGLVAQAGLDKVDIITNLKNLAVNSLDPIKARYGNMFISDAFRSIQQDADYNNPTATLFDDIRANIDPAFSTEVERLINTPVQHNYGNAANVQFTGINPSEYYNIASWIRDNVAYDQIRLEYSTLGSGEPWITVINNTTGQRSARAKDKVVTCMNGQVVANYLVDLTS